MSARFYDVPYGIVEKYKHTGAKVHNKILEMYITNNIISSTLVQIDEEKKYSKKRIRRLANLQAIHPRHIDFGLANERVASS